MTGSAAPPPGPPPPGRTPWDSTWPPGRRIAADGLRPRARRGAIATTWWGRRFVDAVEGAAGPGRVARGRTYARAGQVVSLAVAPGRATAAVQGSRPAPYAVELLLPVWDAAERAALAAAVAADRAAARSVLAGELPADVEALGAGVGLAVFPTSAADLRTGCTCPDLVEPCKHAAAATHLLAEWLDGQPFGVLELHGLEREELLAAVARARRPRAGGPAGEESAPDGDLAGDLAGQDGAQGGEDGGEDGGAPLAAAAGAGSFFTAGPLPPPPGEGSGASGAGGGRTALDDLDASLLGPGGSALPALLRPAYAALLGRAGGPGRA